ncbi:unnamed protein product [Vicia faba]|uniref:Uncharacterized protein n=1 Tax=Vicia faba TaxID=3906 RepID=A0AAV1ASV7_VICFA|nr:unnamed protein product [Vicia faba]
MHLLHRVSMFIVIRCSIHPSSLSRICLSIKEEDYSVVGVVRESDSALLLLDCRRVEEDDKEKRSCWQADIKPCPIKDGRWTKGVVFFTSSMREEAGRHMKQGCYLKLGYDMGFGGKNELRIRFRLKILYWFFLFDVRCHL